LRRYLPAAVFLSVALASLVMAGFVHLASQEAARIKFQATADDALNRIESRLDIHLSLLNATHALFESRGGDVSRAQFRTFFDALDMETNFSGLRGIGYLRLVGKGEEQLAERQIADNLGRRVPIYPVSNEEWRTPVVLYEPIDAGGANTIGFDAYTDPDRRVAIQAAMKDEKAHATGLVQLGDKASGQTHPGLVVYKRLDVRQAASGDGAPEKSTAGFLFASFRATELFNSAFGKAPLLPVNAEVFDGPPESGKLLYQSEAPPGDVLGDDYVVTRQLAVGGRDWTIQFRPSATFVKPQSSLVPLMLGIVGVVLAIALATAARFQGKAFESAQALREISEHSLAEKDLMLQEMKHRIKNSISRVLAMSRQTAANAASLEEFTASFGARLQAMAASQDMLTRSRWQKADLAELLGTELGQAFGDDLPKDLLAGPPVLLDERTTQSLGLTFHELATNTLKYGDMSRLKISWSVDVGGQGKVLRLQWVESGQRDIGVPQKTGFGTKLIDMNVTRELGGTIDRDYRPDGLRVVIEVPLAG
jgi:CHASE1-domain containing sensor protein